MDNTLPILELLNARADHRPRYRYLPSTYIPALLGISHSRAKSVVLPRMKRQGLIFWPKEGRARYADESNFIIARPAVVASTAKGEDRLKTQGRYVPFEKRGGGFKHQFTADLSMASFEIATKEIEGLTLKGFPYKGPDYLEPDADPFALTYGGIYLFFLGFELDRNTEPLRTKDARQNIKSKFERYLKLQKEGAYQNLYGIRNCFFPFLTINRAHENNMRDLLMEVTGGRGSKQFLFQTVTDFAALETFPKPTGYLVTTSYRRAGFPDFSILDELKSAAKKQAA